VDEEDVSEVFERGGGGGIVWGLHDEGIRYDEGIRHDVGFVAGIGITSMNRIFETDRHTDRL